MLSFFNNIQVFKSLSLQYTHLGQIYFTTIRPQTSSQHIRTCLATPGFIIFFYFHNFHLYQTKYILQYTVISHTSEREHAWHAYALQRQTPKQQFIDPAWLTATTEGTGQVFTGFSLTCLNPILTRSRKLGQLKLWKKGNLCNKWAWSGKVIHVVKFILRDSVSKARLCELMYPEISDSCKCSI